MNARAGNTERAALRDVQHLAVRVATVIRRIIGAPDYDGYVAHVRTHHPERTPLTEDEFRRARLSARYSQPGSRCC